MNDLPADPSAALAAAVAPIPTISDSLSRLIKAHDAMAGALNRVEQLADHLAGPPNPERGASTVVADNRPGLAVLLANIVAQFEETSTLIVGEVSSIERAIG